MSSNTNLETLAIEDVLLYPNFDTTVTNYEAEVSNSVTSLNILAIPEDEEADVEILTDFESDILQEGNNLIIIKVTASDGIATNFYEIKVHKRTASEEKDYEAKQEENKEKLEKIYNEMNTTNAESSENVQGNTYSAERTGSSQTLIGNFGMFWIILGGVLLISIIAGAIIYRRYRRK